MTLGMIKVKDLRFSYEDSETVAEAVLDGLDLSIQEGSFVALLGHNGCGKSTLAKHFNAMLLPLGGQVLVQGMDTADENKKYDIRSTVGLVLQNPDNQLVSTIVEEDVAFGPENLGIPPQEIRERVENALKTVGMWEYRGHDTHKLSGGQKQRIAIAGVLAMQPKCLVLDEPTAMLDPHGRREVMDTVCRLNREQGMTVVLITHYMEEAVLADRVVVMNEGNIVLDGVPREVFTHVRELRDIELDVPQPTELCYRLRQQGIEIREDVLTVEECTQELLTVLQAKK